MSLLEKLSNHCFRLVHGRNLVYNTCWEDPRLDRVALGLSEADRVVMITSAGCNALDYVLAGAGRVDAVDMNPRQNALLEMKKAAIRTLDYDAFFAMFGEGRLPDARRVYHERLRAALPAWTRRYWDRKIDYFVDQPRRWRSSFYFRGTAGLFARLINVYIDRIAKVRDDVDALLNAPTLEAQRRVYDAGLEEKVWKRYLRWLLERDSTLSLLGVPRPQRVHLERDYPGGITEFMEQCVRTVFRELPIADNYFWRVYLTGGYTRACCPEYLKPENFDRLKGGLVDRVATHTASVAEYLERHDALVSRFVLLDHMDWLCDTGLAILEREWQAIVDRAAPGTRLIWRSGGLRTDFVNELQVQLGGRKRRVGELLTYHPELAAELHPRDRVHTYGSFYIADLSKD